MGRTRKRGHRERGMAPVEKHWVIALAIANAVCMHALKGLALPRASHSSEITLVGSRLLRSTLTAAPVPYVHAVVIVTNTGEITANTRAQ